MEGNNVHLQPAQLPVDDGCFTGVTNVLEIVRETWCHCSDIPCAQLQGSNLFSLLFLFLLLFFFFFLLLLGAQLTIRLSVFTLNPTHPVRLTDRGEAAPYWLGAAQLKAGGSCPMRHDGLSYRRKQPLASNSTPIKPRTYNR